MQKRLSIKTDKEKQVYDLTDEINALIKKGAHNFELCTVFIKHTTAAVTVVDMDPGAEEDYMKAFDELIPDLDYKHPHDPQHMPDHILGAVIGPSVTIPVTKGSLELGTWQRVVLMEFSGPRERTVIVSLR